MKKLLILISFFALAVNCFATDYYVTSGGNNTTGLSPANGWQDITKLNASLSSVNAGDRVLFNKGETFYGQINLFRSGTSGNTITFGAYGTGVKPVITGFTTITSGWTNEGGGIYSKVITADAQTNMVTVDGITQCMGRFPDAAYLTYQTFSTNTSITSSSLTGTPNYTGSEVVIRKNDWTLDRCNVTSQTTSTLNYTSLGTGNTGINNYGFFLQNGLQFVTAYGEWWHDFAGTGKFYMFFGGVNPNTVVVNVATKTYGINNSPSFDYIVMDNLTITGTIIHGIHNNGVATNCVVQNCKVQNAGGTGIRFNGGTLNLVSNDSIMNCNYAGVEDNGTFSSITNCYVYNIGMILGAAIGGSVYSAIFSSNGGTITNNFIRNAGYDGIIMKYGGTVLIQNNIVDSTCVLLNDGGGIYTPAFSSFIRYIDGNVVTNVIGNFSGTTGTIGNSAGIYLDEAANNCRVTNNTISNIPSFSGIKMHRANNCLIRNNTTYNCAKGLDMLDFTGNIMRNDTIRSNTFLAVTSSQLAVEYRSNDDNISLVALMDSNYYARPIDDNLTFRYKQLSNGSYITTTLAGWKTLTTKETNSQKAPKTIASTSELTFQYNATGSPVVYNFTGLKKMLMNGISIDNSIAIPAWSSVILFDNGTAAAVGQMVDVATGEYSTQYVKSDGTVWVTFNTSYDVSYAIQQIAGLSGITSCDGGQYTSIFRKSDGTVYSTRGGQITSTAYPLDNLGAAFTCDKVYSMWRMGLALKSGQVYYWSLAQTTPEDMLQQFGTLTTAVPTPRKLIQPSGKTIVKLAHGAGLSPYSGAWLWGLASDGTLWQWDASNTTPFQVTGKSGFSTTWTGTVVDIGGNFDCRMIVTSTNQVWIWGYNAANYGGHSNWQNVTMDNITSNMIGVAFPLKQIAGNYLAIQILDANNNKWGIGCNQTGTLGTGYMAPSWRTNWNGASNAIYTYDYQPFDGNQGTWVKQPGKWSNIKTNTSFVFYAYGQDMNNNWYSWGRNKAQCLGQGFTYKAADQNTYPDWVDVPAPRLVTPLTQTWTVDGIVNIAAARNPISNAGINDYLSAGVAFTTLYGTGSHQNQPSNSLTVTMTNVWTRTSGPNTPVITNPTAQNTTVTGLIPGTYIFRNTVTNSAAVTDYQEVTITVTSSISTNYIIYGIYR